MYFWIACTFPVLFITNAFAAAGAAHGSPTDLIAPTINVAILLGVLVWKLKDPLKNYFNSKSNDVANTLERANLKSKEAQMMLDGENRKLSNLENEIKEIYQQAEKDVDFFVKNVSREMDEKSYKLKADANAKIKADKKAVMDALNAELLNQVIAKTKTTIKTNKDYQNKVSTKLLKGL